MICCFAHLSDYLREQEPSLDRLRGLEGREDLGKLGPRGCEGHPAGHHVTSHGFMGFRSVCAGVW